MPFQNSLINLLITLKGTLSVSHFRYLSVKYVQSMCENTMGHRHGSNIWHLNTLRKFINPGDEITESWGRNY